MPFCGNCGSKVESKFCPECGAAVEPQLAVTTEGEVTAVVAPVDPVPPPATEESGEPAVRDRYRVPSDMAAGDTIGETDAGAHTDTVHQVFNRSREQIAYHLKPSPKRVITTAIKLVLMIVIGLSIVDWLGGILILLGVPYLLLFWLQNRAITYKVTSERLEVESGVLSSRTHMIELLDVVDAQIHRTLFGKIFGYSLLTLNLDAKKYKSEDGVPQQHMVGLPSDRVKEIRDFIREAGMQDASRMDRVRIR